MNCIFVFVVCGKAEHIHTLHFSIRALKKFSSKEIIVVTDSKRNEIIIEHNNIVDIQTPSEYDHHQASIYLKTGLHKFLSKGNTYCYLDTDVVAISEEVNNIFDFYIKPITFCTDHCVIDVFSPSAVKCGCEERFKFDTEKFQKFFDAKNKLTVKERVFIDKSIKEVNRLVQESKRNKLVYLFCLFKYVLPIKYYHLNSQYKLEKKTGIWFTKDNVQISAGSNGIKEKIKRETNFKYDEKTDSWTNEKGEPLSNLNCPHLRQQIFKTFQIKIPSPTWQHWNGGVFLFDDQSSLFLNDWHEASIGVFNTTEWKTRDQGTLAMTVWKHQLQNHSTLPIEYNYLADYFSNDSYYEKDFIFYNSKLDRQIGPNFVHIYHHWGDDSWQLWQDLKSLID